jgi:hypothetical protein
VDPIKAAAHPGLRFVMVTATLPQHAALQLKDSFRDLALVAGPGLHRTAAGTDMCDLAHARGAASSKGIAQYCLILQQHSARIWLSAVWKCRGTPLNLAFHACTHDDGPSQV